MGFSCDFGFTIPLSVTRKTRNKSSLQKWLLIPGLLLRKGIVCLEHLIVTERQTYTETGKEEEEEEGRKWGKKELRNPGTRWKSFPLDKFGTI